jgi:hypothetical protein
MAGILSEIVKAQTELTRAEASAVHIFNDIHVKPSADGESVLILRGKASRLKLDKADAEWLINVLKAMYGIDYRDVVQVR